MPLLNDALDSARRFARNVMPTDERQRLQEELAKVPAWKKQCEKLATERAKIQARVDAGELTGAALRNINQQLDSLRHRINQASNQTFNALVAGCANAGLQEQMRRLRHKIAPRGARIQEIRQQLDRLNSDRQRLEDYIANAFDPYSERPVRTADQVKEQTKRVAIEQAALNQADQNIADLTTELAELEAEVQSEKSAIKELRQQMALSPI